MGLELVVCPRLVRLLLSMILQCVGGSSTIPMVTGKVIMDKKKEEEKEEEEMR